MTSAADEAPGEARSADRLLRLSGLSKSFGAVAAVADVTLDVAAGECVCLLGPSGCGKSTLLRLIGGFEEPDRGTISLDGQDLVGVPPHRRPLNTMFQSYALFPHMTVGANVAYGLKRDGLPRAEIAGRVDEMLRLVRLEGLASRYPDTISGGQRQRVALARALARRPRLLLLDEPLGALDRKLREETQIELKALQARLGTTFVVVTHDQEEAMVLADRIGVMDRGRLVQVGAPRAIYAHPKSRFVAGFVGDINLFEGRVIGWRAGLCEVAIEGLGAPLRVASAIALPVGAPVTFGVRPEGLLRLHPDDAATTALNLLEGRLDSIAYKGGLADWRVTMADDRRLRMTCVESGTEAPPPAQGASVRLAFRPEAATLLDA